MVTTGDENWAYGARIEFCSTFLPMVTTGDENWAYGHGLETRQHSSQWRSPNSPKPKKARQVVSKFRSMLTIF
jgi:hypothetical protein